MVNQLPQGWKEVLFNSIFDVCNSGKEKIKQSEYLPKADGLLPVVDQGQNLVSGYSDQFQKVVLAKDNPLIVFGDHTRCVKYIDFDFVVGADGTQLIRTKENTLVKLGYYQLMSANIPNNGYSRHFKYVKEQTYKLIADKGEQKYIVDTLDAVAEMIKLRKETIQLTKDLIPAIFQEMFGNIRGSEPIKKHVIVNPRKVSLNDDVEVSFFSMADVSVDGYILSSQRRRYSDVRNGFSSFMNDDVILAKITPCYENGKGAIVRDLINGIGFGSTEFYVLRCDKQYILPEYLFYLLRSDDFMELGKCHMKGAAGQKRLDKSFLQNFGIVYPPLPLQKEFADKVEQINQNLEVQQKDLERLQELFDQLLQKAFTGELTRGEDYGKH